MEFLTKRAELLKAQLVGPNKKQLAGLFDENFTHLKIRNLTGADQDKLKLSNSNLKKFQDFPLTDLILELNNLINIKSTEEYFQRQIATQYYSK
jgi:hypothetical protein